MPATLSLPLLRRQRHNLPHRQQKLSQEVSLCGPAVNGELHVIEQGLVLTSQDLQQLDVACSEVLSIAYLCSSRTAVKQARTAQCKPVCVYPTSAERIQLA